MNLDGARGPLERLLCIEGRAVNFEPEVDDQPPRWLRQGDWRIFARPSPNGDMADAALATFLLDDGSSRSLRRASNDAGLILPFDLDEAYDNYVSEQWTGASRHRRLSKRQLRLFYLVKHAIPRQLQLWARRTLIRWQGEPRFPTWPVDASVSRLLELYAFCILHTRVEPRHMNVCCRRWMTRRPPCGTWWSVHWGIMLARARSPLCRIAYPLNRTRPCARNS